MYAMLAANKSQQLIGANAMQCAERRSVYLSERSTDLSCMQGGLECPCHNRVPTCPLLTPRPGLHEHTVSSRGLVELSSWPLVANTSLYDKDGAATVSPGRLRRVAREETLVACQAPHAGCGYARCGSHAFYFRLHGVCSSIRVELALPSFSHPRRSAASPACKAQLWKSGSCSSGRVRAEQQDSVVGVDNCMLARRIKQFFRRRTFDLTRSFVRDRRYRTKLHLARTRGPNFARMLGNAIVLRPGEGSESSAATPTPSGQCRHPLCRHHLLHLDPPVHRCKDGCSSLAFRVGTYKHHAQCQAAQTRTSTHNDTCS